MRNPYLEELSRRLGEKQIKAIIVNEDRLEIILHGQPVFRVFPDRDVVLLPVGKGREEAHDLYHSVSALADEVHEYVEVVQNAPLFQADSLQEKFRLLADFGGAVLAGRERGNGWGYQFVTWVWDYDRRGVSHGHYFEDNFQSAKQDFAVRSGLISRAQMFTPEQLTEIYRATDFFLEEGPEPNDTQLKAVQEVRRKIEYTVSDLQARLEQAPRQGPELRL